jgi:RNA polymerase sigma factor (sigma-70 family)
MRMPDYRIRMRDSEVVAAISAGDPTGLAEAYDRYAGPLFSFCRGMLREPADAADVVQDTFVIAVPRMSSLRDPERLRPWLYTVARNECLRRLRGLSLQARLEEAPEVTDEADVTADVEKAELRALVREALPGMGPAEQEVLDLQLRHGLASHEVASVLGVSRNHAHALMSRARVQLEASLGVLVVARTGRRDCPELDVMLAGWDGRLTVLMRKRVNRHVERCTVCSGRREREMTPAMLLGVAPVLALPMASALPAALRDQVMRAVFGNSPAAVAQRAAAGRTPYSFGHHGFPQPMHPLHAPWWQAGPVHLGTAGTAAVGTAAAAAVAAGVTLAVLPPHHPSSHHPGGGAAVTASGGVVEATTRGPVTAGPPRVSAVATASATPSARTPSPSPSSTAAATSAPASASASASASATTAGTLTVSPAKLDIASPGSGTITLTASGGPVSWSVSVPPGQTKKDAVVIAPTSGTLADGDTITITVTVESATKPRVKLTFSPGGETVKIVVD